MNKIEQIILERDKFEVNSSKWNELNNEKARVQEELKPSTNEMILYFLENDLTNIEEGFTETNKLFYFTYNQYFAKRSLMEYNPSQRHPIPYLLLRYQDKYFFILREKGSGELRLIGKKGCVGGHIGIEDYNKNVATTIMNGLYRELQEEVGVTVSMVKNMSAKGIIKGNDGVDKDHLGLIIEVELTTDNIKAEEDGVLTGLWINKEDLHKHYDSFESWSKMIYDNLFR